MSGNLQPKILSSDLLSVSGKKAGIRFAIIENASEKKSGASISGLLEGIDGWVRHSQA